MKIQIFPKERASITKREVIPKSTLLKTKQKKAASPKWKTPLRWSKKQLKIIVLLYLNYHQKRTKAFRITINPSITNLFLMEILSLFPLKKNSQNWACRSSTWNLSWLLSWTESTLKILNRFRSVLSFSRQIGSINWKNNQTNSTGLHSGDCSMIWLKDRREVNLKFRLNQNLM